MEPTFEKEKIASGSMLAIARLNAINKSLFGAINAFFKEGSELGRRVTSSNKTAKEEPQMIDCIGLVGAQNIGSVDRAGNETI